MPRRSTPFQRLIFLVNNQLADSGSVVTESKMLPDRHLNDTTEVDTCIEATVAGHKVIISFECRESSRPLGKGWVQQMWAKHENLPTSVLVLVSNKGFTKSAIAQASFYGIETVKLEGADADAAEGILTKVRALGLKLVSLFPTNIAMQFEAVHPDDRFAISPEADVFSVDGVRLGSMLGLVSSILKSEAIIRESCKQGRPEHTKFQFEWQRGPDSQQLYFHPIDSAELRRLMGMNISGRVELSDSHFSLQHAMLGDTQVSWGDGEHCGAKATIVMTEDAAGKARFSIDTGDQPLTAETLYKVERELLT